MKKTVCKQLLTLPCSNSLCCEKSILSANCVCISIVYNVFQLCLKVHSLFRIVEDMDNTHGTTMLRRDNQFTNMLVLLCFSLNKSIAIYIWRLGKSAKPCKLTDQNSGRCLFSRQERVFSVSLSVCTKVLYCITKAMKIIPLHLLCFRYIHNCICAQSVAHKKQPKKQYVL